MGDGEIPETYLNSASKSTSETDIFPHGPKSLLTIVISFISIWYELFFTEEIRVTMSNISTMSSLF